MCREGRFPSRPYGVSGRRLCPPRVWVFGVVRPSGRVIENVLSDLVEFLFVSDYAFVVVALPHVGTRR